VRNDLGRLMLPEVVRSSRIPDPGSRIVVCVALLVADTRRRGERALWANLGISTTQLVALGVAVCVASETLLAVALT
jgi:hypothetical protein